MTVMVWYSQGGGYMLCDNDSDGMVQSRWGGGYMLCDSDGMVESRWGVHVV